MKQIPLWKESADVYGNGIAYRKLFGSDTLCD